MENVDISEWVRSALVIDDKWGEVKGLIRTLNSRGVSTSYYNPNPQQDFLLEEFGVSIPEELEEAEKYILAARLEAFIRSSLADFSIPQLAANSVTGYNLIFLDINFGFDAAAGNIKSQVNLAVQLFADALSEQSTPYGVVLWSKDSRLPYDGDDGQGESTFEYIKNLLYKVALPGKPKPLFVIDLDKSLFWENTDYAALTDALKRELRKDKMAKFFAYWNKEVLQSAALTCKDIQEYAEKISAENKTGMAEEFFNILKYATYSYFGFPREARKPISDILSRYSFSYLASQLHGKLHSHFCLKDISLLFKTKHDHIYKQIKNKKNKAPVLRSVVGELNFRTIFDVVKADVKGLKLPGLIYCRPHKHNLDGNDGSEIDFYVNITPPCDVAQGKKNASIYLSGTIYGYDTYHDALGKYKKPDGDRYYKTPPVLYCQDNYLIFKFDLRSISRKIAQKNAQPTFILKDSIFADLMQKFGHHNSRLGARTFN